MSTLNEKTYVGDVLRWEAERNFSRTKSTVVAVAALVVGAVLAKKDQSTVTEVKASGTGDGVIGEATLGALAQAGIYKIVFTTTGATAKADVRGPAGELIGILTVGTAFASDHINLTVADGTADWTAGDVITVTVAGDDKFYPASYGATDGTGEACAILLEDLAITTGKAATILARDAIIVPDYLIWDSSYDSDAKKNVAFAQLAAKGIIKAVEL